MPPIERPVVRPPPPPPPPPPAKPKVTPKATLAQKSYAKAVTARQAAFVAQGKVAAAKSGAKPVPRQLASLQKDARAKETAALRAELKANEDARAAGLALPFTRNLDDFTPAVTTGGQRLPAVNSTDAAQAGPRTLAQASQVNSEIKSDWATLNKAKGQPGVTVSKDGRTITRVLSSHGKTVGVQTGQLDSNGNLAVSSTAFINGMAYRRTMSNAGSAGTTVTQDQWKSGPTANLPSVDQVRQDTAHDPSAQVVQTNVSRVGKEIHIHQVQQTHAGTRDTITQMGSQTNLNNINTDWFAKDFKQGNSKNPIYFVNTTSTWSPTKGNSYSTTQRQYSQGNFRVTSSEAPGQAKQWVSERQVGSQYTRAVRWEGYGNDVTSTVSVKNGALTQTTTGEPPKVNGKLSWTPPHKDGFWDTVGHVAETVGNVAVTGGAILGAGVLAVATDGAAAPLVAMAAGAALNVGGHAALATAEGKGYSLTQAGLDGVTGAAFAATPFAAGAVAARTGIQSAAGRLLLREGINATTMAGVSVPGSLINHQNIGLNAGLSAVIGVAASFGARGLIGLQAGDSAAAVEGPTTGAQKVEGLLARSAVSGTLKAEVVPGQGGTALEALHALPGADLNGARETVKAFLEGKIDTASFQQGLKTFFPKGTDLTQALNDYTASGRPSFTADVALSNADARYSTPHALEVAQRAMEHAAGTNANSPPFKQLMEAWKNTGTTPGFSASVVRPGTAAAFEATVFNAARTLPPDQQAAFAQALGVEL